jgi:hypothetical protein
MKATDHELQKYDNFTRYGHSCGIFGNTASASVRVPGLVQIRGLHRRDGGAGNDRPIT